MDSTSACFNFDKACLFNNLVFLLYQTLCNINLCESDVYNALTSLEPNKAIEIDGIGPNILKICAPLLYKPLHC